MFSLKRYWFHVLTIFLFWGSCLQTTNAQSIFKAGVFAGGNFSQINHDSYAGYHKIGIHGGIKVITRLSPKFDFHTELVYNQKGSFTNGLLTTSGYEIRDISLSYLEIPLLISIKDWEIKSESGESYYATRFYVGAAIGRLIGSSTENFGLSKDGYPLEHYFNKTELSLLAGASFYISPSIAIEGRFSYGSPLTVEAVSEQFTEVTGKLTTYFITLRAIYIIS